MRSKIWFALCASLAACEAETGEPVVRLDGGIDGGAAHTEASLDAGRDAARDASAEDCTRRSLCKDGVRTDVDGLCTREHYGKDDGLASVGLYHVCLVAPNGTLYTSIWRGDVVVTSPGWTYSGWSNGLVPGTLSPPDATRCSAERDLRADASIYFCEP